MKTTDVKVLRRLLPRPLAKKLPQEIMPIEISEKQSRVFNLVYRNKNVPANVLSFSYGNDYGEILICPDVIRREAKAQGNTYKYQLAWMILHGMIHLAGLHHEKSERIAKKAEQLEDKALKKLFPKVFR